MNNDMKKFYVRNTFALILSGLYGTIFTLVFLWLVFSDGEVKGFILFIYLFIIFFIYWCFFRALKLRKFPFIHISENQLFIRKHFSTKYDTFEIKNTKLRITTDFVEFSDDQKLRHIANTINVRRFWSDFIQEIKQINFRG